MYYISVACDSTTQALRIVRACSMLRLVVQVGT